MDMSQTWLLMIANVLSAATIMSCIFLKIPQIMSVRRKKSSEGIYVLAILMEITSFSIVTLYNFTNNYSYMTYLEYPIILVQLYTLLYYVLKYKGNLIESWSIGLACVYWTAVMAFAGGAVSKHFLNYVIPFCSTMSGAAKVAYIYGIIKIGNADNVARSTWVISILTNLSRVFTVYVDSADKHLMANMIISTLLSSGVLGTALYYQIVVGTKKSEEEHESDVDRKRRSDRKQD